MSEGRFTFFIAECNQPVERDRLIRELEASLPDLQFRTVRLSEKTVDPLDEVLAQAGDPPPGPVMVVDWDRALPSDQPYHPVLQALNMRRPIWPQKVPQPIVFWVPEYAFTIIAREAPDFLDWRSGCVFFPTMTERDLIPLRSDVWDESIHSSMSKENREARVRELESRLALYGDDAADRSVQAARLDWLIELANHHDDLSRWQVAIQFLEKAVDIARRIGDGGSEGHVLNMLGSVWS